ncbi:hypothetical protein HK101_007604 [Irineochytrium annulatum]|nr:hypothetical protein HK101_007604 [Irineochytrium annulatum]
MFVTHLYKFLFHPNEQVYRFKVSMSCEKCKGAVTKALASADGIAAFNVDLGAKEAEIRTSRLSVDQVEDALRASGKAFKRV